MKSIDLATWPRRNLYRFFSGLDYPYLSISAEPDITALQQRCKTKRLSMFKAVLYGVSRAANAIEEFRIRIRDAQPVVHDVVHPSFTVLTEGDLFCFCESKYTQDMEVFFRRTEHAIAAAKDSPSLEDGPGRDDYLFISSLPWLRFTSITNPVNLEPADAIPRIVWGKFTPVGDRVVMPLSVQVHHGLVDGLHVSRFFGLFQKWADQAVF